MSRIITFALLLGTFCSYGQIVNIPDAGFKVILVNVVVADLDGDGLPDDDVDTNNDGEVQVSEAEAVIGLLCDNMNQNVMSLEGIQSFANLEVLDIVGNNINDIDVTQNASLKRIDAWDNAIASIDVTQNPLLEYLWIGNNPISELDVTQNPNLERLYIYESMISNLDVTNNPELIRLGIGITEISTIDLSQNPDITGLFVYNTNLTAIDVTVMNNLDQFYLNNTDITSIDLSQNPNLRDFRVDNTNVSFVDASQNPNLEYFIANDSNLNGLNLASGNNTNLIRMWAHNNPNLLCIQVDDVSYSNSQICDLGAIESWCKDETASYSEQCEFGIDKNTGVEFSIYPNPTTDILFIEADKSPVELVRIFSSEGKRIATFKAANSIDVSQLVGGLYFLEIYSEGQKQITKFIKN